MIAAIITLGIILLAGIAAVCARGWLESAAGTEFEGWDRAWGTADMTQLEFDAELADLIARSDALAAALA